MPRRWLLAAALCSLPVASTHAVEFPYVAYVNAADVYVRSGPGRDYYPTQKLAKGEAVEVYRHDPGGWLAIRPPRGSYSWVSARHLDLLDDELAEANSERVVARVGSTLSDVRDVIQVRLDKSERVVLVEPPDEASPWCKIAPPAGEFRWVFSKYVDRELPEDLVEDARDAGPAAPSVRLTSGDGAETDTAAARADSRDLARLGELERIDMDLSAVIAQDVSQWRLEDLQARAQHALDAADGSLERGRVHLLMDKLTRFADLKRRHDALAASGTALARSSPDRAARSAADPRFDGVGRLSPVVSPSTGGPQFALMDAAGGVLSFVTPAPGVNLRPYVDQQVGVNGQRSYLTDLKRQHISVQRISVLETERR